MIRVLAAFSLLLLGVSSEPVITSWMVNCDGQTGYGNVPSNVQEVLYTDTDAYIVSTGIPSYTVGPWGPNPNTAQEQDHVFKIPLQPQAATGAHVSTPLGPIGVLSNGVPFFNALDAFSYNNQGIWHQNAIIAEAISFDGCEGHPQMTGVYHHHMIPPCLLSELGDNPTEHSPIIGYAFDGFPIYGPYGYSDPSDSSSAVTRLDSSYRERNITVRRILPDGTNLPSSQWGPNVSPSYPLGIFVEDFEFVGGLGDLDQYNGRFTVTPEYPAGIYAYVSTIDASGEPSYPYLVGPEYYGVPETENFGGGGGPGGGGGGPGGGGGGPGGGGGGPGGGGGGGGGPNVPGNAVEYDGCINCEVPVAICASGPNSSGMSASISFSGTPSLTANSFQLEAYGCPSNQFGVFYYGGSEISAPFGNGTRCVGAGGVGTFRLGVIQTDAWGDAFQAVDFNQPPFSSGSGQVWSGEERFFQFWFRDPQSSEAATFDLTNGLKVTFCE